MNKKGGLLSWLIFSIIAFIFVVLIMTGITLSNECKSKCLEEGYADYELGDDKCYCIVDGRVVEEFKDSEAWRKIKEKLGRD